jgi:hypothetical protein
MNKRMSNKASRISAIIMVAMLVTITSCKKEDNRVINEGIQNHPKYNVYDGYPFILPTTMWPYMYAIYEDDFEDILNSSTFPSTDAICIVIEKDSVFIKYGFLTESEKSALFGTDFPFNIINFDFDSYVEEDDVTFEDTVVVDDGNGGVVCNGIIITRDGAKLTVWANHEAAAGKSVTIVSIGNLKIGISRKPKN